MGSAQRTRTIPALLRGSNSCISSPAQCPARTLIALSLKCCSFTDWTSHQAFYVEEGSTEACLFRLITTAKSQGWLHDLINAAIATQPGAAELGAWTKSAERISERQAPDERLQLESVDYADGPPSQNSSENSAGSLVKLDERRRARRQPGPAVAGEQHGFGDWDALVKALRAARFDTSDWHTMSSGASRLRKELARPRRPYPGAPDRANALAAGLAIMLARASDESASAGAVRSAAAQCGRIRDWLLHLLTQTGQEAPDDGCGSA